MSEKSSMAELLMAKHGVISNGSSSSSLVMELSTDSESTNGNGKVVNGEKGFSAPSNEPKTASKVDLNSMEAFPSLSGTPAPSVSPVSWGAGFNSPSVKYASKSATPESFSDSKTSLLNRVKTSSVTDNFTLSADRQIPNARSILPGVVEKARKTSKASIDSSTNRMGHTSFVLRGKPEDVQKAKRELLKELSLKTTRIIQIPADLRAIVIGARGNTLKPIVEKSGTNIKIDNSQHDEDESIDIDVTIEGDEEGVEIASAEIMAIVSSRVKEITAKIPVEDQRLFPFLEFKSPIPGRRSDNNWIITGDKDDVANARWVIETFLNLESSNYEVAYSNEIASAKHHLLDFASILKERGVLVSSHHEGIELFGPKNVVKQTKKDLINLASKISVLSLDISNAHDKSVAHAEDLICFFKNQKKFASIEKSHKVHITTNDTLCHIAGEDKNEIKAAKADLVSLVNKYGPGRIRHLSDIDAFFHRRVEQIAVNQSAVALVITPKGDILLVYEEPKVNKNSDDFENEDFAPGPQQIADALDSVDKSLDELRKMSSNLQSIVLHVPKAAHKYIQGPNGTTLKGIKGESADTVIEFGTENAGGENGIYIKGLKDDVERIAKEINDMSVEAKDYEKLSNYTTSFQFSASVAPRLVGKQGANLTKLREELGVKIDLDDSGNGTIKGIKKNAEEAKTRLVNMAKALEDETTFTMKVPEKYHASLIGSGGKFVKRLRSKYNVRIDFHSENNEIVIRGPSKGVARTKDEFDELVKYEQEHSYKESIAVENKYLSRIIGRQGENITVIKDSTDTRIDIGDEKDGQSVIDVSGTKAGVTEAISKIKNLVIELSDLLDETIDVDPKYHALLIGPGGITRREILEKAGASKEDGIDIPPANSSSSTIKIYGHRKVVQKVKKHIKDIIDAREKQITEKINIPVDQHGAIIGKGGMIKQEIEYEFDVTITIPKKGRKNSDGTLDESIAVTGVNSEMVQKAIAKIKDVTFVEKVTLPKSVLQKMSNKRTFVRMLQSTYGITILNDDKYGNGKPSTTEIPDEVFGDDTSSEENGAMKYKLSIYPLNITEEDGEVVWKLKGNAEKCTKARKAIEKIVGDVKQHDHKAFLWFADSTKYRFVVGPQGRTVNNIREKSGCIIVVPEANSKQVIEMAGSREQLEQAKELILKAVSSNK